MFMKTSFAVVNLILGSFMLDFLQGPKREVGEKTMKHQTIYQTR